jgi:hypothetical protein
MRVEQHGDSAGPHLAARGFGGVDDLQARGRGDAIDVSTQCRVADQRKDAGRGGHEPTLRACADSAPRAVACLWMNP